jgi:tungstate transport system ATP-binding protein
MENQSSAAETSILPLRVSGVTYEVRGKRLVEKLSFELTAGPVTVILGPNGAGKSITLRLCHGLLQPTAGGVAWQDNSTAHVRRRQAMVFQHPIMLRRSAAANISYVLSLNKVPRKQRPIIVSAALEKVNLAALADEPARVLSAGEQQRLALARAWALQPQVLFLDEPTSTLDPAATRAIEQAITAFQQMGTKVIMTTQDLGQARRLADEILFLHEGKLLEHTPAEVFFKRPQSAAAQAFLNGELL